MAEVKIYFGERLVKNRNGEIVNFAVFEDWVGKDREHAQIEHLRLVFECHLDIEDGDKSKEAFAELAFEVFNSHPEEMHCSPDFYDIVERFREEGNRSLSVGDVVEVNGEKLIVASFGFTPVPDDIDIKIIGKEVNV